ncbi:MAG: hypothetical protein P4M04_07775 [Acidobacteriota bacterium]|nr:hypothetical protein [Acidobacteriota bacterium]
MDQQLKNMMKELGEAINTSLSDSDEIAEVISRIRSSGYDVFLVLEATIGFNERDADDVRPKRVVGLQQSTGALKVTSQDVKFLKSLRIRVDEN